MRSVRLRNIIHTDNGYNMHVNDYANSVIRYADTTRSTLHDGSCIHGYDVFCESKGAVGMTEWNGLSQIERDIWLLHANLINERDGNTVLDNSASGPILYITETGNE